MAGKALVTAALLGVGLSSLAWSHDTRIAAQDRASFAKEAVAPPLRDPRRGAQEEMAEEQAEELAIEPTPEVTKSATLQRDPVVDEKDPSPASPTRVSTAETTNSSPSDAAPIIMRNADLPLYEKGEVLLFMKDGVSLTAADGLDIVSQQEVPALGITMIAATLTTAEGVDEAIGRLGALPQVAWAQPNYIYQLLSTSRSRGLSMHGLDENAALLPQGLPPVTPSAKIAMIDSPVDASHPSLQGARILQKGRYAKAPPSPHGTAISEILVGTGDFPGIVKGAELLSIPAFMSIDPENWEAASISTTKRLIEALGVAYDAEPDVLNLSFGSPTNNDPAIARMIDQLFESGVCIAAAAGNDVDDPVMFPARLPETIAVAAVDTNERGYKHGSRGDSIDIASWGVAINAAVPGGRRSVSGTSFAAPIVAGAMLRMPMCNQFGNSGALRDALFNDAKDLGAPGKDEVFGAGLLRFGEGVATLGHETPGNSEASTSLFYWIAGAGAALLTLFVALFWLRRNRAGESK